MPRVVGFPPGAPLDNDFRTYDSHCAVVVKVILGIDYHENILFRLTSLSGCQLLWLA